MQITKSRRLVISAVILISAFATSCVPTSRISYFNDIDQLPDPIANPKEQKVIMPFDKIYVKIYSIEDRTNQLFNTNTSMVMGSNDFLVNEAGEINFPLTGKINILGLTTDQAGTKIAEILGEYVPGVSSVIVRFVENSVTVMGEVMRQGVFTYTQEELTIYEALALGGGINQYGDRKNVILVRQEGEEIVYHKLNLTNSRITGKELYYIHSNDIIIVEPMRISSWYKFNNSNFLTAISTISSFLSIYTILNR